MQVVSNTTEPGSIEPLRNYLMFNPIDMFVLHILLSYFSQMVTGTVHIDVMERYCCICNSYIYYTMSYIQVIYDVPTYITPTKAIAFLRII